MANIPPIGGGQHLPREKFEDPGKTGNEFVKVNQMQSKMNPGMNPGDPKIAGSVSAKEIEKTGRHADAQKVKETQIRSGNFLFAVLSFIRTLLSYLNIFAYFYKQTETASVKSEKIESPETKTAATPDGLSRAANILISFLANDETALRQEGIFRLSGNKNVNQELVNKLTQSTPAVSQDELSEIDRNSLTGALKELFGQMNLFGSPELTDKFLQLGRKINGLGEEEKRAELKGLVGQLPEQQQKDLNAMLGLLSKVTEFKDVNKMAASNLAIVFGPQLLPNLNPIELYGAIKEINLLTENLITHREQIFE